MFGYVTLAGQSLAPDRQARYRSMYCGLCHTLKERHGSIGRMTLSYDLTFLYVLLSSLYEPDETTGTARCTPHPIKPHTFVRNEWADYCADMNIALAYHKARDDKADDHSLIAAAQTAALEKAYQKVAALYPTQCKEIEACLTELATLEKSNCPPSADAMANLSGKLLGAVYSCREDIWTDTLRHMGESMGRFIYLMDAYDDLPADIRRKRFNPLIPIRQQNDFEDLIKESLTLLIAECTDAFETLPLVRDMDILRNILYAGCWTRYQMLQQKKQQKSGVVPKHKKHKEVGE